MDTLRSFRQEGLGSDAGVSRKEHQLRGTDTMTDMTAGAGRTGPPDRTATSTVGGGLASDRPSYGDNAATERHGRRLYTETKSAFKTTELWVFIAGVAGVLIASDLVDTTSDHSDYFRADRAWLFIVILAVGYLVSRGMAKSGSRDPYDE
jgi:hypothetical protein